MDAQKLGDVYTVAMDENNDGTLVSREFNTKEEARVHIAKVITSGRIIRCEIYKNGNPIQLQLEEIMSE